MDEQDKLYKSIADNVKYYRTVRGLTKKQLTELAELNANAIWSLEHGTRKPNLWEVYKLSEVLNVPLDVITGKKERQWKLTTF